MLPSTATYYFRKWKQFFTVFVVSLCLAFSLLPIVLNFSNPPLPFATHHIIFVPYDVLAGKLLLFYRTKHTQTHTYDLPNVFSANSTNSNRNYFTRINLLCLCAFTHLAATSIGTALKYHCGFPLSQRNAEWTVTSSKRKCSRIHSLPCFLSALQVHSHSFSSAPHLSLSALFTASIRFSYANKN